MSTVKFSTLGCKVNQYETQSIREQFLRAGFKELENCSPADVYVINTCTVTHRADSQSHNLIRRAKRENPRAKIIVTGCLAECGSGTVRQLGRNILTVKNRDKDNIIRRLVHSSEFMVHSGITGFAGHTRAFLKIQDGCDNFCSYCIVPYVRGAPKSKGLKDILCEAKALVSNGFKEIVLTGICLGAFGKDLKQKEGLVRVIGELEKIKGLERIRLSSIEPQHVSDELIRKMAASKKLCPHLHIPLQSGDDKVLKKMKRKYSSKDHLKLIKKIKKHIPGIAITTDILIGFPNEEENNFKNSIKLIKKIGPLKTHIFPYSRRKGTDAAAGYAEGLSPLIIKERVSRMKRVAESCDLQYRKKFIGKRLPALIEERLKNQPQLWAGHTPNYLKVAVKSALKLKNRVVQLKLKSLCGDCILADLA